MGCITKLLASKAKRVHDKGSFVEGGGVHKGYEYLTVLNSYGHRCGYVAINADHPLYDTESGMDIALEMHGGCSFFGRQMTSSECTDKWIGFDCGHLGDARDLEALRKQDPSLAKQFESLAKEWQSLDKDGVIQSQQYVVDQCIGIIEQMVA